MKRALVLGLARALVYVLVGLVTCWVLDVLLKSYTYHDRLLWEGGAVTLIYNIGFILEGPVLRHLAREKELRS